MYFRHGTQGILMWCVGLMTLSVSYLANVDIYWMTLIYTQSFGKIQQKLKRSYVTKYALSVIIKASFKELKRGKIVILTVLSQFSIMFIVWWSRWGNNLNRWTKSGISLVILTILPLFSIVHCLMVKMQKSEQSRTQRDNSCNTGCFAPIFFYPALSDSQGVVKIWTKWDTKRHTSCYTDHSAPIFIPQAY